jgi:hypothetical protein
MDGGVSQALEALRKADDDNRARAAEINALHGKLADAQRAATASEESRERAENRAAAAESEVQRQTQALNVVLKEVSATKETLRLLRDENGRLKEAVLQATSQSQQMSSLLSSRSVTSVHEGAVAQSGAVQYMSRCYSLNADPCPGILRSLFLSSHEINAKDASFSHLAVLLDVIRANPATVAAAVAIDVTCTGESVGVVCDILSAATGLRRVTARDVDDVAMAPLAAALRLHHHIRQVECPSLRVTDAGATLLFRALADRTTLASASNGGDSLMLETLDLSGCRIESAQEVLEAFSSATVGRVDLSNVPSLDRGTLRGVLLRCPAVTTVAVRNCPKLGSDVCEIFNLCPLVRDVDVTGSTGISAVKLEHVVTLRTTLTAVSAVNCPKLVEIPTPLVHFQVVDWNTPSLETITFSGVALNARECTLLSGSSMLRNLALIHCRVNSLDTLLRRMRRLEVLNFNGMTRF